MNFHFFNVDNGYNVREGIAKPRLTQYGPYAYREIRRKENLTHGGANSLYYKTYYSYAFDQGKTNELNCYNAKDEPCSDQDTVYVLNPIVAMIGPLLPELSEKVCELLPSFLEDNALVDKVCKAALSGLESMVVDRINEVLDGTQNIQDDLIFNTTVDKILYSVSV